MDNIELVITEDAVKAVAKKAKDLKTGARGLRAIVEEAMKDIMFFAPSQNIEKISKKTHCFLASHVIKSNKQL